MNGHRRSGFSLLEVILALTTGALVLGVLGELIGAGVVADRRIRGARAALDSAAVARSWLRMAFRNAEAGQPGNVRFEGHTDGVKFSTRVPVPSGWHVSDVATIRLQGSTLVLQSGALGALPLVGRVRALHIDYLGRLGADSPWLPAYDSPVTPALAVRLRLDREGWIDTLLFRTGAAN